MELNFNSYSELKSKKLKRAEIADIFGIPEWKLKKLIAINGWGKKAPTVDEDSFSELSEAGAYWAGFIAADGNVDNKKRIRIMLKYDDILHIEKFAKFVNSTHAIQTNTDTYNRCAIEFTSAKMCNDLSTIYNIGPNKTDKLLPPIINTEFIPHFIRGVFDGDGSICESFSNANSITATLYATLVSGSIDFTSWLETFLEFSNITFSTQNKPGAQQIKLNTLQAIKFLNIIYQNSTEATRLDRKYAIYKRVVLNNDRLTR